MTTKQTFANCNKKKKLKRCLSKYLRIPQGKANCEDSSRNWYFLTKSNAYKWDHVSFLRIDEGTLAGFLSQNCSSKERHTCISSSDSCSRRNIYGMSCFSTLRASFMMSCIWICVIFVSDFMCDTCWELSFVERTRSLFDSFWSLKKCCQCKKNIDFYFTQQ